MVSLIKNKNSLSQLIFSSIALGVSIFDLCLRSLTKSNLLINGGFIMRRMILLGFPVVVVSFVETEVYGLFSLLLSLVTVVTLFLSYSLVAGFIRYFYEFKNRVLLFRYTALSVLVICLINSGILVAFYEYFPKNLNTPYIAVSVILISLLLTFSEFVFTYLRLSENFVLFNKANYVTTLAMLGSILILIVLWKITSVSIEGLIYIYMSLFTVPIILFVYFLRAGITWRQWRLFTARNRNIIKSSIGYSVFILPANIGFFINEAIDKFVINEFLTVTDVAIYSLVYQFSFFVVFVFFQVSKVNINPYIIKYHKEIKKIQLFVNEKIKLTMLGVLLVYFLLILFQKIVFSLVDSDFNIGQSFFNEIFIAAWISIVTTFFIRDFRIASKTGVIATIEIFIGIFNFCCNLYLVPRMQLLGAAYATLLSYMFRAITYFIIGSRYRQVQYPIVKIILIIAVSYVFGGMIL